jgi:aminomethyltransferase
MKCDVLDGTHVVGRVTAGAWSPYLESGVGYVRFDAPGEWVGRTLSLRMQMGEIHSCEIVKLPFYDPEKRIARGLETLILELP